MKFNYQARTKDGQIQSGVVEASSKEAAVALLQKHDLFVTFLSGVEAVPFWAKGITFGRGVSQKDIVVFSRQLAVMFKSNVSLLEALQTLAEGFKNQNFKEKILRVAEEIEGGSSLSQALSLYPQLFSPFYVSLIKSGETSGNLSGDLEYLADHLEREQEFQSKVLGAMIYPAFVCFVAITVLVLMTTMVIPKLAEFLQGEVGQNLPWITVAIMSFSKFMQKWILLIILTVAGVIAGFIRYIRTDEGKKIFDETILKLPIIGELQRKICLTRIAENLSTLIAGGLPIAQALEISANVVGNTVYRKILLRTRDEVRRGEAISEVFKAYPDEITPIFVQMTVVGEKTGQLDSVLLNIVNFYQKETERALDNVIALLEPLMIIFLAGIVAFIMLAILLPIYQTVSAF